MVEPCGIDLDLAFSADPPLQAGPLAREADWQHLLEAWLRALQAELPPDRQASAYSLGLSLVDDAAIAALNSEWRDKAGPTDVLAFAALDESLDGAPAMPQAEAVLELGDIVISLDTAARQAPEHGHTLQQELLFLASHGLLHLLGWDHPDAASLTAMLQRQEQLCSSVNVQVPGAIGGP